MDPVAGHDGNFSWGKDVTESLSPQEFGTFQDQVLQAAVVASLIPPDELDDIRDVVQEVLTKHPDWSLPQIRQGVREELAQALME